MQISLQLKENSCRSPQAVGHIYFKGNMAPTKDPSIETIEWIIKLIQKSNP